MAWPFAFGFAQGQPIWWMHVVAMALLAGQLDAQVAFRAWKHAAWLGGLFATAMLCGTFWWLFISMHTYGGLAAPLTALAIVLLAAFLGLYYAVACGLFVLLAPAKRPQRAIVFAAVWLMAELARVPGLGPLAGQLGRYFTVKSLIFEVQVDVQIDRLKRQYFALLRRNNPRDIQILNLYWR